MAISHFDRLCKKIFDRPEAGADLARNVLSGAYLERIDLGSARIEKGSFIDRELRLHASDLLLRFERKDTAEPLFIYVLVDHKSEPDRWASLQLLRYVMRLYQNLLKQQPTPARLPEVVPVILYHGLRPWKYPLQLSELIESLSSEHVPKFLPVLYDLNRIEDGDLVGAVQTVVGLLSLKYIKRRFTVKIVRFLLREMRRLPENSSLLKEFYTALLDFKEEEEIQLFLATARQMRYREKEEDLMSYAQQLRTEGREEGIKEGIKEGREKGLKEGLKRLLDKKFGLTPDESRLIDSAADIHAVEAAIDSLLNADRKEEVLNIIRDRKTG